MLRHDTNNLTLWFQKSNIFGISLLNGSWNVLYVYKECDKEIITSWVSWFIQIHSYAKFILPKFKAAFQIGTHVQIYFIQDVVYWISLNFVLRCFVPSRSCEQDSMLYSIDWRANMEFSYLLGYNWACIFQKSVS